MSVSLLVLRPRAVRLLELVASIAVREHLRAEKRAVTGGELLIPTVVLDIVRERVEEASKLLKHVRLRSVPGKARQTVAGVIPEAVWTEQCAKLNELAIDRQILVRQPSGTYRPISQVTPKTGDRVAIRLTLTGGQDMQFVCLTDARAACFEPVDQLSGYRCRESICYYQEVRNTETRFYFDFLPKGTYVITYELDIDRPGDYTQGLSTIQCLYAPQIIARTPAQTIVVK